MKPQCPFFQRLSEGRREQEKLAIDRPKHQQEWIAHCAQLMAMIKDWLKPLEEGQYLEIVDESVPIREEQLGDYEAPALRVIFITSQSIMFRPTGRFVIGAEGRVDVVSGSTLLVMLVHRGRNVWEFAKREGRYGLPRTWPLNRGTFEEFLASFLED